MPKRSLGEQQMRKTKPDHEKKVVFQHIATDQIHLKGKRLRMFRPDLVHLLAESMQLCGLLTPIALRPKKTGGYWLVCGWHRLEAAKLLGWATIRASVSEMSDAEAEMAEVTENLVVAYLGPAERALYAAAREEVLARIRKRRGARSASQLLE
jgi:ParB family transcriptional regulator, chromosome partitioning protein